MGTYRHTGSNEKRNFSYLTVHFTGRDLWSISQAGALLVPFGCIWSSTLSTYILFTICEACGKGTQASCYDIYFTVSWASFSFFNARVKAQKLPFTLFDVHLAYVLVGQLKVPAVLNKNKTKHLNLAGGFKECNYWSKQHMWVKWGSYLLCLKWKRPFDQLIAQFLWSHAHDLLSFFISQSEVVAIEITPVSSFSSSWYAQSECRKLYAFFFILGNL